MSALETADDQFLTEDINKEDDILDDLDNAAEEELLHFSEDDDFLDDPPAEEEVEYIDEDGNLVELREGEQIEVLEGNEMKEDETISPEETEESFEENSAFLDSANNSAANVLDEEDDDDEDEEEEARRNRFRTERRNIVTINSSKRNNRDIPDSLDSVVLEEEAAKAAEFMNREKEKRRGGWRGNRRGFGGPAQRIISRKQPPLLSVMPQPQNKPKLDHQQLGIVSGATRLPPPKNFTQPESFMNTQETVHIPQKTSQQLAPQTFEGQPNTVDSGMTSPRKILINPHFRGNRTQAPTTSQRVMTPKHPESAQYEGETLPKIPSFSESHHYDPSPYNNQYEPDPNYGDYDHQAPPNHNYPPPPTIQHQGPPHQPVYHPHVEHQNHPPPNYQEFGHHPPQHLQRPPPPHQPPYRHPHHDTWNGAPTTHHPPPPRMPHHPGGAPPPQHLTPPPPHHYEPRYRSPPQPNHMEHHQHHHPPHPPPHMQRFQDPHHFHSLPPLHLQQPYPPPPHHLQHFRPPPPNLPNVQEYRPPPPHHYSPVSLNEEYQHPYNHSYQTDHSNQFAENEPDLYKSFDNSEWNDPNYAVVPQSLSLPGRGFHHQTSRGLKHGFIQRRPINKRPVINNEAATFVSSTSPKQMRLENRAMSKNIKEVPITEIITPAPLPPGKEILPPEDEDEETKELRRKLEEQKKQREENLRKKEERRRLMAAERLKKLNANQKAQTMAIASPNPQPKPIPKPLIKPTPNLAVPKLIQGANLAIPNSKKKVVVVRRAQGNLPNQQQISGNSSQISAPKMVLVRGTNRGNLNVRGRGRGVTMTNQFGQRINQFGQRINANVVGSPPFSNPRGTGVPRGIRLGGPLLRQEMTTARAPSSRVLQANPVRQVNPLQRIFQPGGPVLKMVRKMAPIKVPANRQVIVTESQENLASVRRVELQGETPAVTQSQNTRVVRPPQNTQDKCVLINNLSATTTENQLRQLTQPIGAIEMIKLMKEGRAVITFKQPVHATQFQQKYQRHMLDLSMIQVSMISSQLSQLA